MKYRVHRLEVKDRTAQEKLERFLNRLEGEVLSVVPYSNPTFQGMGATSKIDFLLIVEKTELLFHEQHWASLMRQFGAWCSSRYP